MKELRMLMQQWQFVTLYEVNKYSKGGDITMADLSEVQEFMNGN